MAGSVTAGTTATRHAKRDATGKFVPREKPEKRQAPAPAAPEPAPERAPAAPAPTPASGRLDPLITEAISQSPVKQPARPADPAPEPSPQAARPAAAAQPAGAAPARAPAADSPPAGAGARVGRVILGAVVALAVIAALRGGGALLRRLQAGQQPTGQPSPQDAEAAELEALRRRARERGIDPDA